MSSKSTYQFGFESLADAYLANRSLSSPAELHGLLTGELCAGNLPGSEQWRAMVDWHMGADCSVTGDAWQVFEGLPGETWASLEQDDLSFEMILPDDDTPLPERLAELGNWSRGFMEGLVLLLRDRIKALPEESREMLQDLAAIARVGMDEDEGHGEPGEGKPEEDASETRYAEVAEYVRMVAMHLFIDCQGLRENTAPAKPDGSLH